MYGARSTITAADDSHDGTPPSLISSLPSSEVNNVTTTDAPSHITPTEHRRNRKSWTEEEQRAFWRQKKQEKKERKRAAAAARQDALQAEWEGLTEAERESRRAEAAEQHERRRCAEAALLQRCAAQLSDVHVPALVFDLSFAWCMTVADTKSTVAQVKLSYSALRAAGFPFRPVMTSLLGKETTDAAHDSVQQRAVLQALNNFEGFRRFPPQVTQDAHWCELFPADKVVFLTADAPDVLTTIERDTAYVIGAFVDHNQHKGLSYAAALRHGVRTARLPIKESVKLGNRCKVLTINHVVNVLIRYDALRAAGTPDWGHAIDNALPTRRTQQEVQGRRKRSRLSATCSTADDGESGSDLDASEDD
jgi:tRNA (guanine9-N1)-methyltransferase